jgi:hypothetical protein
MNHTQLPHYHIRWHGKALLDWERFSTHEDATARAKQLAHPGEGYALEEHDETCPRCQEVMKPKSARGTSNEASA